MGIKIKKSVQQAVFFFIPAFENMQVNLQNTLQMSSRISIKDV
jgi:hypothetical protein